MSFINEFQLCKVVLELNQTGLDDDKKDLEAENDKRSRVL